MNGKLLSALLVSALLGHILAVTINDPSWWNLFQLVVTVIAEFVAMSTAAIAIVDHLKEEAAP